MASLFSVFLALMPLMTLQAGNIQQSCNNGDSACTAKANSLLQVQRGDASQTKLHKVVTADPGEYSEVGMNEGEEKKGTTPGDNSGQGKGEKQEQEIQSANEEPAKGATPGDNSGQEKADEEEQEIQRQNEEPEDGEGELEGEAGLENKDEEGEEMSQEDNEVEGHAKPTGESVPLEEEDTNYICANYGKSFSTASDAEGYFHTQCVHEYEYSRALCDELSEKVFEKWEQDRSASWKPDSDVCAEINALLRADVARRHEIGLKPAVASPPELELLQRSKLSHSGQSARSLDETHVLKDSNQPPIQGPYPR